MEGLKGLTLRKFNSTLRRMGDFLFHEGPIQSHYINDKDEDYLFFWADADDNLVRWMVVRTTAVQLHQFFLKKLNTLDLIVENPDGFVHFIDVDSSGSWKKITLLPNELIPSNYFPSKDSFYIQEHYENYAYRLKAYLDYHFTHIQKLYSQPIPELHLVNEPTSLYKPKK